MIGVIIHNESHKIYMEKKETMERVRAVLVDSGEIILINRIKENTSYWVIPGGGVEENESHKEAIKRECLEELGVDVSVGGLFFQKIAEKPAIKGQKEFFYFCSIVGGKLGTGSGPEFQKENGYTGQYIVKRIKLKNLPKIDLRPREARSKIFTHFKIE